MERQLNILIKEEEPPELSTKRINDLELQERVKEKIPKATADNIKWWFKAWEKWRKPFTVDEERILWNKGLLGRHNPGSLLDTMVFLLGKFFALRGRKERRSLKFKQFTLIRNEKGLPDKLCYNSFGEKNCEGRLKGRKYRPKRIDMRIPITLPDAWFNFIENTFLNGEGYSRFLYFHQ